jgi:chromosomal replication initiation ATPase DnaA
MLKRTRETVKQVADFTGVPTDVLLSSRRGKPHETRARFLLCWVLHTRFNYGPSHIGRLIGRHHTTVWNALHRVDDEACEAFDTLYN